MTPAGFIKLILLGVTVFSSAVYANDPQTQSSSPLINVTEAFSKIVSGRTLKSEDGCALTFGIGYWSSSSRYLVPYTLVFSNGHVSRGFESVSSKDSETIVDQIIENVMARSYFASVEGPLSVLRIKPTKPEFSDFISRDCVRKSDEDGTICYVKVRYMNDVIVSIFREFPAFAR